MIIDFITIFLASFLLGIPLGFINAIYFHNKSSVTVNRILFNIFIVFLFSQIITHITITMKGDTGSYEWLYYIVGLFFCVPNYLKNIAKQCNNLDHLIDGLGFLSSFAGYGSIIFFQQYFYGTQGGFLNDISLTVNLLSGYHLIILFLTGIIINIYLGKKLIDNIDNNKK